jgi:hypothetical protein
MLSDYEHSTHGRAAIGFVIGLGGRVRRGIRRATPQNDFGGGAGKSLRAHGAFGKLRPLRNSFCLIQSETSLRNKETSSFVKRTQRAQRRAPVKVDTDLLSLTNPVWTLV